MTDKDTEKDAKGWAPMGGGPPQHPKFVLHQVENLTKIRRMLEEVVGQKQSEIMDMREKLARLKHGGGS